MQAAATLGMERRARVAQVARNESGDCSRGKWLFCIFFQGDFARLFYLASK